MNAFRLLLLSPGSEALLRWTALLMLAWVVNWLLRRSHPRWRLILWRSVLVLGCSLPLGMFFSSSVFQIPIDTLITQASVRSNLSAAVALGDRQSAVVPVANEWAHANSLQARPVSHWVERLHRVIPGKSFCALIWIVGCAAGTIRLFRLQAQLSRLRKNAREPNSELLSLAKEIQARLNVRQTVAIRISDEASSPFVCGLWRPTIMLPAQLLRTLTPVEMRALLSHEMAHLRSHDLAWSVGWRWLKTMLWFHPLAWKIPGAHNLACEQEADRIASNQWTDPSAYPQLLAQLVLRVLALPPVETTFALNGGVQIVQRLNLLRRERFRAWKWRDSLTGFSLVAGLVFVATGWGFSRASAADEAATDKSKASNDPSARRDQMKAESQMNATEMTHYESSEWNFAIDIPKSWNRFPPVSSNSPYEVVRFESQENGSYNDLIIFRNPHDPKESLTEWSDKVQQFLVRGGFENFVFGKTTIGSRPAVTLDFDKPGKNGGTWSCRHYFIADGTLGYVLGFGTFKRAEMADLYDRMAKSFQIQEPSTGQKKN